MPARDGTGPAGKGPFTGKALGDCAVLIDREHKEDNRKPSNPQLKPSFKACRIGAGCARKNRHRFSGWKTG